MSEALRVMRCAAPAFGKKGTNGNTASNRRRTQQQQQHKRVNRAFASAIAEDNAATAKEVPAKGTKYEKENEIALDAVRIASTICDKVQAQLMRMDEKSITKGDKSLVTLADYAAQAVIAWRIGQDEPDMKFLGEEDADALVNGGEDGKEVLGKITVLVNEAIRAFYPDAKELSDDDVVAYSREAYDRALAGGKPLLLDFFAPW